VQSRIIFAAMLLFALVGNPFALRAQSPAGQKTAPRGIPPGGKASLTPAAAIPVLSRGAKEKIAYCKSCHGDQGQGYLGYFPIPRLAGQQPEYIESQLSAFSARRRLNPIMSNVAHALSPKMLRLLSNYFHKLKVKPYGTRMLRLVEEGKNIYQSGAGDIPPCASCHGDEAHGNGPFPRLAGQLPKYTIRSLTNWSRERGQDRAHPDSSAIMEPIAHGLKANQIKAIAAYVGTLP
jgi:cytochrome c553